MSVAPDAVEETWPGPGSSPTDDARRRRGFPSRPSTSPFPHDHAGHAGSSRLPEPDANSQFRPSCSHRVGHEPIQPHEGQGGRNAREGAHQHQREPIGSELAGSSNRSWGRGRLPVPPRPYPPTWPRTAGRRAPGTPGCPQQDVELPVVPGPSVWCRSRVLRPEILACRRTRRRRPGRSLRTATMSPPHGIGQECAADGRLAPGKDCSAIRAADDDAFRRRVPTEGPPMLRTGRPKNVEVLLGARHGSLLVALRRSPRSANRNSERQRPRVRGMGHTTPVRGDSGELCHVRVWSSRRELVRGDRSLVAGSR